MVFDVTNKDLRLLLRALLKYQETAPKEDTEDIARMKGTIVELLKEKRKRYQY